MPEHQITWEQVKAVLYNAMQPITVDDIAEVLMPNPTSPAALNEAKATILQHLQTAQAAGDVEDVDNELYYLVEPLLQFVENLSATDESEDSDTGESEESTQTDSEDSGYRELASDSLEEGEAGEEEENNADMEIDSTDDNEDF